MPTRTGLAHGRDAIALAGGGNQLCSRSAIIQSGPLGNRALTVGYRRRFEAHPSVSAPK